jgi:ABC-2 type transport system permease protein
VIFALRDGIVSLLAVLFMALVMISAGLGWSATSTVSDIYAAAAAALSAAGAPVPPNPVHDISPLPLMRNMVVYVALIGALAAIAIGNRLVTLDRRAGVLPLIGVRPLTRAAYARGKMGALTVLVAGLTAIAALCATITFAALPTTVSFAGWLRLAGFFGLSALYMGLFGLVALGAAAGSRSETVGLLVPATLWLTVTFILPTLTGNIHPTAAINPVSALATAPDSAFFAWTGWLLGPLSVGESYKFAAAALLDFLPAGRESASALPPLIDLLAATALAGAGAYLALSRMDPTRADLDV